MNQTLILRLIQLELIPYFCSLEISFSINVVENIFITLIIITKVNQMPKGFFEDQKLHFQYC